MRVDDSVPATAAPVVAPCARCGDDLPAADSDSPEEFATACESPP